MYSMCVCTFWHNTTFKSFWVRLRKCDAVCGLLLLIVHFLLTAYYKCWFKVSFPYQEVTHLTNYFLVTWTTQISHIILNCNVSEAVYQCGTKCSDTKACVLAFVWMLHMIPNAFLEPVTHYFCTQQYSLPGASFPQQDTRDPALQSTEPKNLLETQSHL